jgi:hypothetical protein
VSKILKSQQGMIDIILIAVIAVAAIGLGGYVIYQQNQTKKAEQAAGNGVIVATKKKTVTPPATPKTDPNAGYLVIKDWGVRFAQPTDLDGLQYSISTVSGLPTADFTTTQHSKAVIAAGCTAADASLGTIERLPAPSEGNPYKVVKIDKYYYQITGPGPGHVCLINHGLADSSSKLASSFYAAAIKIEAATAQ